MIVEFPQSMECMQSKPACFQSAGRASRTIDVDSGKSVDHARHVVLLLVTVYSIDIQ